jgi:hypothetical protein
MRLLAFFGFLFGEGAMVVHLPPRIKMAKSLAGA